MASITAPVQPAPAGTTAATTATAAGSPHLPVVAAAAVGALSGVLAAWAIVATQTLQMSL